MLLLLRHADAAARLSRHAAAAGFVATPLPLLTLISRFLIFAATLFSYYAIFRCRLRRLRCFRLRCRHDCRHYYAIAARRHFPALAAIAAMLRCRCCFLRYAADFPFRLL